MGRMLQRDARRRTCRRGRGRKATVLLTVGILWALLTGAPAGAATNITLGFTSLPSAQGWNYESDGAPEASIFSVAGGVLTQDTTPGPFSIEGYRRPGVVDPSLPFTLSVRARVLAETGTPQQLATNPFGFAFFAGSGAPLNEGIGVGIGTDKIADFVNTFLSTSIDNTQFHDYRLEGEFGVGYDFYVDGVHIASGPPRIDPAVPNGLYLGDSTRGVGAQAEVTAYSFVQADPPVSADDCKNGGWQNHTDAEGRPFKNQGDCVSYVATGGTNTAAG
jgi:hypothetical protein